MKVILNPKIGPTRVYAAERDGRLALFLFRDLWTGRVGNTPCQCQTFDGYRWVDCDEGADFSAVQSPIFPLRCAARS
jgi:hypothetical protein